MGINSNLHIIKNINNFHFDYKSFLSNKETLHINNCKNIDIIINSKINKLVIENSNKVNIIMTDAICGIEINKCENVKLEFKNINSFLVFKSKVQIKNTNLENINIVNEKSKIKKID